MNKTVNINLAGFVMHVDEEAYSRLRGYLESVRRSLGNAEGAEEIIRDVEARLVELFQERMGESRQVVMLDDVDAAIAVLGQPEDYKMTDGDEEESSSTEPNFRPKKKVFRNPDDKIIGGVAGGLSAYLGIDAIWLRLLLVALFFAGPGFLLYIILWIVMPEARTTAQKLQMRGEPVNLSSIEKSIREELKRAGKSMNDTAKELSELTITQRLTRFLQNTIDLIVNLLKLLFVNVFRLIGIFLVVLGVFIIISLTLGLFFGDFNMNGEHYSAFDGIAILREMIGNPLAYNIALAGIFFVTVIPTLFIIALAIRHLFKLPKLNPLIFRGTVGMVVLGFILLIISGIRIGQEFAREGETESIVMLEYEGRHHRMELLELPEGEDDVDVNVYVNGSQHKWMIYNDDIRHFGMVEFDIESTNSDVAFVELHQSARGRSNSNARFHAKNAHYEFEEIDSIIRFPVYYSLSNDEAFRFQEVDAVLKLPIGHSVYLDEKLDGIIKDMRNVNGMWSYEMLGHTWEMTEKGLRCLDCPEHPAEEESENAEWDKIEDIPERI